MILWLLIAVGAVVLAKKWSSITEANPSAPVESATPGKEGSWTLTKNGWHQLTPEELKQLEIGHGWILAGAPAPQPAPGEIVVPPTLAPTLAKLQGETPDKVPVNKPEPLKVWYTL